MSDKKVIGFIYALNGLKQIIKHERNFNIHLISFVVVCIIGFVLSISLFEWMFVLIVSAMVIVTESINSTIEHMMDYIEPSIQPDVKKIKDMAAGSVLITVILAIIVGLIIFLPKFNILLN